MRKLTLEGKRASYTNRNGKKVFGNHLEWIIQWESKTKALVLQKIDFSKSGEEPPIRFRIGYYRISKNGRLTWARNSPIFNKKDFDSLLHKARSRKGFFEA
jgi:hypothetical protein